MRAVLHTGESLPWAVPLGLPWPLLPVGNRPWIEFWIERCVELGIREVDLVLGDGAHEIERYVGDGSRWGISVLYGFLKPGAPAHSYLARNPDRWAEGVLHVPAPCFPRREETTETALVNGTFALTDGAAVICFRSTDAEAIRAYCRVGRVERSDPFPHTIRPEILDSVHAYYELNMALVRGEMARYLTPGYARRDGAYLGYDVVSPATTELVAPLIIGNQVRLHALSRIGPNVVMGNRVIVDQQVDVRDSIVLDGTYLGAGIEVAGRIVAGRRLVDPSDGTAIDLDDPHLLAPLSSRGARRDWLRLAAHRLAACVLFALLAIPALAVLGLGLLFGGRYRETRREGRRRTINLSLWIPRKEAPDCVQRCGADRWPMLWWVVRGDLWLCGQSPRRVDQRDRDEYTRHFPALFTYGDGRPDPDDPIQREAEDAYYEHHRGLGEDVKIFVRAVIGRLAGRPWHDAWNTEP